MKKIGFSFDVCSHSQKILSNSVKISLWGTGKPLREFLHVDDLASASIFLMENFNVTEARKSNISYFNSCIASIYIYDVDRRLFINGA